MFLVMIKAADRSAAYRNQSWQPATIWDDFEQHWATVKAKLVQQVEDVLLIGRNDFTPYSLEVLLFFPLKSTTDHFIPIFDVASFFAYLDSVKSCGY